MKQKKVGKTQTEVDGKWREWYTGAETEGT
jgi:hypothetical protein